MSDTTPAPAPDHNLPPITKIGEELTHHARLWTTNIGKGDGHKREIMVRAFRLRLLAEDPEIELRIEGMLSKAGIPSTKRSGTFTRLLNFAFHKADWEAEKSRVSRWAGALEHAWKHQPRLVPEQVPDWIRSNGGDETCAKRAREELKAKGSGSATRLSPLTFTLACGAPEGLFAEGETEVRGVLRLVDGALQVVRSKRHPVQVVSVETTPAAEPVTPEA